MPVKAISPRWRRGARIARRDFAPGAATGWHTHGWPYFEVMLTDTVMKMEAADGAVSEMVLTAAQPDRRRKGPKRPARPWNRSKRLHSHTI